MDIHSCKKFATNNTSKYKHNTQILHYNTSNQYFDILNAEYNFLFDDWLPINGFNSESLSVNHDGWTEKLT